MRITVETDKGLIHHRKLDFVSKAVSYLKQNYHDVIAIRGISDENLELAIQQSYDWTALKQRPSKLLALRVVSARLCYGTFFMDDPRYETLQKIVNQQLATLRLTDDDPIFDYLALHQTDWANDWFKTDFSKIFNLVASRKSVPRESSLWLSGTDILRHLLQSEARTGCHIPEAAYPDFIQLIKTIVAEALPNRVSEQEPVLLAIGQYYDGLKCFNDPLRPRWFNALAGNNVASKIFNIHQVFKLDF